MATETITVLFTDLVGSTELLSRVGERAAEQLRREHFGLLRAAVEPHGGREVKNLGDGLMVVFDGVASALEAAVGMQQAMTARTLLVHQALGTQANWDAPHWSNVTSIPGVTGTWDAALSTNLFIKKSLNYGVKRIMKSTLSKVRRRDLQLVINPNTATAISETQELTDVIKQSPEAYSQVTQAEGRWSEYGLLNRLFTTPQLWELSV